MNAEEIIAHLKRQYYVIIPFAISRLEVDAAIQAFFKFLNEPEDIKKHIDFTIAPQHRRGDVGYKHRNPEDHIYNDSKDFFHYNPEVFNRYPEFLDNNPAVMNFMLKAKPIWEEVYISISRMLQQLDTLFPGTHEKVFGLKKGEPLHILLRFLKYDWRQSTKYLAKPHFDAGSFTLAVAESCPGLRIGSCPENLQLVNHKEGNAIFMLASNYQKVIATNDLLPGWHDVIQLDETLVGKPFARWAMVAFIDALGVDALTRNETHRWSLESMDY